MKARIVVFMIFFAIVAMAAVPQRIQYQGKLTDMSGVGENDTLDIRFKIFDVETGGDSLWAMTIADVPVVHGMFDVNIGPIDLPFDEQYWLEIVVDGEVLAPRVQLTSSPYAFRAAVADSFTGGVPPWTQDTMVAYWDSIRGVPDLDDGDWTRSGDHLYPFNTSDSVVIGGTTAYDKLDVNGSMTIRGDGGSLPHGSGLTSNEEHIRLPGSHSDYIVSVQDGSGRIQHYWNSTTASPENLYLESDERAWMWDISVATHPYMEFKYAPTGVAGDPITWTTHMAFDTLGNVDILGDVTANAFIGDGSGLTGISDGSWTVSGDDMYSAVSGNVGVGLDDPDVKFQVCGDFEVLSEDYYMYITDGSNVIGSAEPRLPCDVTDGFDCPDTVITTTDLGPVAYDYFFYGLGWASLIYNRTSFIRPSIMKANTADRSVDIDADVEITGEMNVTGKVGIGTANPVDLLHVEAYDDTVGDDDSVFISIRNSCNSDSAIAGIRFKSHSTDGNSFYKSAIAFQRTKTWGRGNLHFLMNDQENNSNVVISATKMTLTSAGQLGIGTTTPQNKLDVSGGAVIGASYSGTNTAPSNGLLVEGNVGIGITSPASKLDVSGKTRTTNFQLTSGASNGHILKSDASGNASWVNPTTINDGDWTISGDYMYAAPYYVGIGTTTPDAALEINFNSSSALPHLLINEIGADYARLYLQNTDTTAFWAIAALPADNPANAIMNFYYPTGGNILSILGDGKVGISNTNPSVKLDVAGNVRADDFIEYSRDFVGDAVSILKDVRVRDGESDWRPVDHKSWPSEVIEEYTFDSNDTTVYLPRDAEYTHDGENSIVYGRSVNGVVSINTRAIQQLIDRMEKLEAENDSLRARIEALETNNQI